MSTEKDNFRRIERKGGRYGMPRNADREREAIAKL